MNRHGHHGTRPVQLYAAGDAVNLGDVAAVMAIGPDGQTWPWLLGSGDATEQGCACPDCAPHEQPGPLPLRVRIRIGGGVTCWFNGCQRPAWFRGACVLHAGTACQGTTRTGQPCHNRARQGHHGEGSWCSVHDPRGG